MTGGRAMGRLGFVGRAGPMGDVDAALEAARHSRGTLLLITGEAGIGKSRLAQQVTSRAEGFRVMWTWCSPSAAQAALRPWSRVVRALAGGGPAAARVVQGSPYLSELLAEAQRPAPAPGDLETARWHLTMDLADLLSSATSYQPVLVVVDDLHEADPSTLQVFVDLAPALRSMAAVVLATAREDTHKWLDRQPAWEALTRLGENIRLGRFGEAEIAMLLQQALGEPAPAEMVRTIASRTAGNPLLACELIRALPEATGYDPASMRTLARSVPTSVRAMVSARLAGATALARRVLSVAAVLGTPFRLDVLAEVAELPLAQLGAALGEARAANLLGEADPGEGGLGHELIRDALYEALPVQERMRLHQRAATVLARLAQRGRGVQAAEVAHHLLRAGPGCAGQAAEFASRAGALAMRLLAFEDAVRWYSHADTSLAIAGAADEQRARMHLALGEAKLAAGDRRGAREALLDVAETARQAGEVELLARAALGLGAGPVGFEVGLLDRTQIDLLEQARAAVEPKVSALAALVSARLSVALTMLETPQRRLDLARDALDVARQAGDDAAVATALAAVCDAMAGPDHTAQRHHHATEIITLGSRLREPAIELLGRRLRLVALLETGAIAAAEAEMLAYQSVAQQLRHPLYLWYVPLWRGMRALLEGRLTDCREALADAAAMGARAGSDNAALLVAAQRWCLLAELGDQRGLAALLAEFDALNPPGIWPHITRGLLLAQVGRQDEARAQLDATAPLLPTMPRDSEWLPAMAQLAKTVGITGPHQVASWVYGALSGYAELFAVEGIAAAVRAPVHYPLGVLAATLGDRDSAAAHFAAATRAARALGAPRLIERISADAKRLLGTPGRAAQPALGNVFRCDGDYWTIRYQGVESRLRDRKGLHDLRVLLARPGWGVAALDLAAASGPAVRVAEATGARTGQGPSGAPAGTHPPADTGELLDAPAREAYQRRLSELESEITDADAARHAQLTAERDALLSGLSAAYGLGGRSGGRVHPRSERVPR